LTKKLEGEEKREKEEKKRTGDYVIFVVFEILSSGVVIVNQDENFEQIFSR
jgi:hypothetical protein